MSELLFDIQRLKAVSEDKNTLLDIHDTRIRSNETIILAGANGAGKTLFLRSLTGLVTHPENLIFYQGKKVKKSLSQAKDKLSFVPQNPEDFMLGLTVREDILFSTGKKHCEELELLCNAFDLRQILDRPVMLLSGGEKKRVSLASALITGPDILLLDEPFSGLDYRGVQELTLRMLSIKEQGITTITVTHDLSKVLGFATRVIILSEGIKVFDSTPESLLPQHEEFDIRIPSRPFTDCTWLT